MIWQIRSAVLVVLLFAAAALGMSSLATATPTKTKPPGATAAGATKPAAHAPLCAFAPVKPGAGPQRANKKDSKDDKDDDDDDAKDFPPLKKGESFHLIGFSISGSKHIDEDAIIALLPEHQGDSISDAQIAADSEIVKKALIAAHVHSPDVTQSTLQRSGPDHCMWVIWDIQHIDAFSGVKYQGYWKFGGQTFSGNKALTNEQLEKAIDLKPDERVREGAISDAITGMQQAYDKVFPGKKVEIKGKLKLTVEPARVANFEWQIVEPTGK